MSDSKNWSKIVIQGFLFFQCFLNTKQFTKLASLSRHFVISHDVFKLVTNTCTRLDFPYSIKDRYSLSNNAIADIG